MTATVVAGEPFHIGACLRRALSVYLANFISFTALGLMVMVPGFMLLMMTFGNVLAVLALNPGSDTGPLGVRLTTAVGLLGAFIFVLALQYLLTAAIVYTTGEYLRGNDPPAAAALSQALRRVVPIIGLAAVTAVLVWIGIALLVVPGIIVALMFSVAVPVLMVEGKGVTASLSRSRELTRGLRWQLLGFFLAGLVGCMAANALVMLPFDFLLPQEGAITIAGAIIEAAVQLFTTVFLAVLPVVAYHDLRSAKEDAGRAQLLEMFG
jgi:hypothetical protein